MRNQILLALFLSIFLMLLSSAASANILLTGTTGTYNLGDIIGLMSKVSQPSAFNGFFQITLVCENQGNQTESMMYFSPISLDANKEKTITVNFPVTKTGSCHISAVLEDNNNVQVDEAEKTGMILSDRININVSMNKQIFLPSDTLSIQGSAIKDNGYAYTGSGFLVFEGQENIINVNNGKFSFSQKLSDTIAPGNHQITINIKDSVNNSGNFNATFEVASVPRTLAIETNNESIMPGALLIITPKMLDQANNTMDANITTDISQHITGIISQDKLLLEQIIESGNNTLYYFNPSAAPGQYLIEANTLVQGKVFSAEKIITVPVSEEINITISNSTAEITNIGNVPYNNQIELDFIIQGQSTKKILDLDLGINETKEYRLEAPNGNYDIIITKGTETSNFSNIPLTGSVVAAIDIGQEKQANTNFTVATIIFVVLALLIVVWFVVRKQKREVYYGAINQPYNPQKKQSQKQLPSQRSQEPRQSTAQSLIPESQTSQQAKQESKQKLPIQKSEKQVVDTFSSTYTDDVVKKIFKKHASAKLPAHSVIPTLVYGTKQEISVLVLSILGFEKLQAIKNKDKALYERIMDEYFSAIVDSIKSQHGVADIYGNNIIAIFNVIKQYRHDVAAVKVAQSIRNITNELNAKLINQDIVLGTKSGINIGMAIVSSIGADKEVKYTSIGNTTTLARLLERKAVSNEILLTDNIYNRVSNVIKARKISPLHTAERQAIDVYSVTEGTNTEMKDRHKWYVDRALKG